MCSGISAPNPRTVNRELGCICHRAKSYGYPMKVGERLTRRLHAHIRFSATWSSPEVTVFYIRHPPHFVFVILFHFFFFARPCCVAPENGRPHAPYYRIEGKKRKTGPNIVDRSMVCSHDNYFRCEGRVQTSRDATNGIAHWMHFGQINPFGNEPWRWRRRNKEKGKKVTLKCEREWSWKKDQNYGADVIKYWKKW